MRINNAIIFELILVIIINWIVRSLTFKKETAHLILQKYIAKWVEIQTCQWNQDKTYLRCVTLYY